MNNKIIDLTKRLKETISDSKKQNLNEVAPVLDMTVRREEVIQDERRQVRRTIMAEFVGAFVVIPGQGLQKVNVYDLSESGLAFDMDFEVGHFNSGEEFAMRLYLSKDTYIPFTARVSNFREISDEGVFRHGVQFVKESTNSEALGHFVKFLETVTASLQTDKGDRLVTHIK